MSNTSIRHITTLSVLREFLRQQEMQRVEAFTFQPGGALNARYPGGKLQAFVLDAMPLACRIHTSTRTEGDVRTVTCTMTYRSGVRMLDAWRCGSMSGLTREELLALPVAENIAQSIRNKRREPMDRLYLLYSYVAALVTYRKDSVSDQHFHQLASGAWALVNKEANCQGFADLLYLLGSMLGFKMGMQGGMSRTGGHMWNTIELDGCRYAMDASVAALDRHSSQNGRLDYASFLMGKREALENGLTWKPEEESLPLSASLAQQHDFYCNTGYSASSPEQAARLAWKRRFEGERLTQIRIRAKVKFGIEDVKAEVAAMAEQPAVSRDIQRLLGGSYHVNFNGQFLGKTAYVTVEWPEK